MKIASLLAVLLGVVALAACGDESGGSNGRLSVVATTTQVADIARNVGGDRVDVHQILTANADPHGYEPRPGDARALAEADLIVSSGGEVDEWLDDLVESAGTEAERTQLSEPAADPHWWQDPRAVIATLPPLAARLAEADPGGRRDYMRNAEEYGSALARLDGAVAACVERIPARQRRLVTTHDALGPYARRYGLEVVGALIPSRSTRAQPNARATERLIDQIRSQDVAAIFPESSLSPKLEDAVARETGAEVGSDLYADSLGEEGSAGETYIGSLTANTAAIVAGLTGGEERCRPRVGD